MLKNKFSLLTIVILSLAPLIHLNAQETAPQNSETFQQDENSKLTFDKVDSSRFYNKAVLQILNKTTAKASIVEVGVGEKTEMGKLFIKVDKCWQAPLDQKPDSRVLLEVFETKADGAIKRIFFGWMISSSPSISSLEHPIYDVTALSCKNK